MGEVLVGVDVRTSGGDVRTSGGGVSFLVWFWIRCLVLDICLVMGGDVCCGFGLGLLFICVSFCRFNS